jgi:hypothetical protein
MSVPSEWENMTDIFKPEAIEKLNEGEILSFDYEGSRNDYRIVQIKNGEVWGKKVTTYTPDEAKNKAFQDARAVDAKDHVEWDGDGLEPHPVQRLVDINLEEDKDDDLPQLQS